MSASGEQEPLEGLTASKRRSAGGGGGAGAGAGAVLGDKREIDEVMFEEPRQELGHELAEDVTVVAAEVVEAVIGDCAAAAQPAVGGVELDEPRPPRDPSQRRHPAVGGVELDEPRRITPRADAITGGIDPEPQEDLGVGGGCTGALAQDGAVTPNGSITLEPAPPLVRAAADIGVAPAQIEPVDDGGDRTHLVIGGQVGVEVAPSPGDLAALRA